MIAENTIERPHKKRQSNLELLRIISMTMIVIDHFVLYNSFQVLDQPVSAKKVLIETLSLSQGRVGVILFFTLSVWFLCNKEPSIHDSWKRIWELEKTVLFWSLLLGVVCIISHITAPSWILLANILFPSVSSTWWYVSTYMAVLLLLPFLISGLRAIGRRAHFILVLITLLLGPITELFPFALSQLSANNLIPLLFLLVLVTYVRWYKEIPSTGIGVVLVASGYVINAIQQYLHYNFEPDVLNIGVLVEAFGWFAVCYNVHFSSKIVNWIASRMFAVYLITEFAPIRNVLWSRVFNFQPYYYHGFVALIYPLVVLVLVFTACIVMDAVKSFIFKHTVSKNRGKWFEALWIWARQRFNAKNRDD